MAMLLLKNGTLAYKYVLLDRSFIVRTIPSSEYIIENIVKMLEYFYNEICFFFSVENIQLSTF